MTEPFGVRLRFHGDLDFFLKSGTNAEEVRRQLKEATSVKDVIESCGVPHTEVDQILVSGVPVDFSCVLRKNSDIIVYPVGFREEDVTRIIPFNARSPTGLSLTVIWENSPAIFDFSGSTWPTTIRCTSPNYSRSWKRKSGPFSPGIGGC